MNDQTPGPGARGMDSLPPPEIARACEAAGVQKAARDGLSLVVLGLLAGVFIAFGAMGMTVVLTDSAALPWGVARVLAGLVFSLGLILVIAGGAELFTGDALMIVARASGKISTSMLLRAWLLVYLGNILGALGAAALAYLAELHAFNGGGAGKTALAIASAKAALPVARLFFLAVLCNVFVCLAVWMSLAGRNLADKVLVIVPPVTVFVAAGLEHSIANIYILFNALAIKYWAPAAYWTSIASTPEAWPALDVANALRNIVVSTLGNLVGGSLLVGLVYWFVYLRPAPKA